MPNYCFNGFSIIGNDQEEIDRFHDFILASGRPFDFNLFIPAPADADEQSRFKTNVTDEGTEIVDFYDWYVDNWGTDVRNACDVEIYVYRPNVLYINFETAWSPPLGVFEKMGQMFPTLAFTGCYDEPDMGINGSWETRNGNFVYVDLPYSVDEDEDEVQR